MRLTWRTFPYLLRRSLVAAFDDNCFSIAKGAAYSALLSFFPVITASAALLVQTRAQFVSQHLERFLSRIVPPGAEELVLRQFRLEGERPVNLLGAAAFISIWAASSVIKSLMEGFHAAYRVPRSRGFLRESGVAICLVLLSAIPVVGASALIVFGGQIERQVLRWMHIQLELTPVAWLVEWTSRVARFSVAFGAIVLVTGCLYYFGPYRVQRWRSVWPGAVLATLLWLLATSAFAWYVRNLANYNVMYGSVATIIALLVWMYLMAAIALVGCEFNAEYERLARI